MGGRGRGGFGRGGGRGGFGAGGLPPMGLTFADIQAMSKEGTALYPPMLTPILAEITPEEDAICSLQLDFGERLRKSPYYLVEKTKSTELPRYIDKYKPSVASRPTLKRSQLHAPFFPAEILEAYFNPKKKRKAVAVDVTNSKRRMNIDEMAGEDEEEKTEDERSDNGSQAAEEDYDVDEDYGDNDYADNYFDNGEDDNMDDMAGGGDEGGGGGEWD